MIIDMVMCLTCSNAGCVLVLGKITCGDETMLNLQYYGK